MRYVFTIVAIVLSVLIAPNTNAGQPIIDTYAGTGLPAQGADGLPPDQSALYLPWDVTVGPDGLVYIVDWNNHRIRVVENGLVQKVMGDGSLGDAADGPAATIRLNHPTDVRFDASGNLFVAAWHNSKVLRMDKTTEMVESIAGSSGLRGFVGDGGPAIDAILHLPSALHIDAQGHILIADQLNQRIRRIDNSGIINTIIGSGVRGYCGDGGAAIDACLDNGAGQNAFPAGKIAADTNGNLFIADTNNHVVRMVDTAGIITTVAGSATPGFSGDGGPATSATLNRPGDVAVGPDGHLYIADSFNHCIRRVDNTGSIATVAGTGAVSGYAGDGGTPTQALLREPYGVAFAPDGTLYISDTKNHRIRIVELLATVPTLLSRFSTTVHDRTAVIRWELSDVANDASYELHRASGEAVHFEKIPVRITRNGLSFEARDADIEPGQSYRYRLDVTDEDGLRTLFTTERVQIPSAATWLGQNRPNPFNPTTTIAYALSKPEYVRIVIYAPTGAQVRTLVDAYRGVGPHTVEWDGLDSAGKRVSSGVYFYRLRTGGNAHTRRMILLK